MLEGLTRHLNLSDFLLTSSIGAHGDFRFVHLGGRFDLAFDAGGSLRFYRRVAVPVPSRHLHLLECDHVIIAFDGLLYFIHSRLKECASGFHWNVEMDLTFITDRKIRFLILSRNLKR